ncbi:hypothetical protein BGZ47_000554, partial [Haplosporangium gracile]
LLSPVASQASANFPSPTTTSPHSAQTAFNVAVLSSLMKSHPHPTQASTSIFGLPSSTEKYWLTSSQDIVSTSPDVPMDFSSPAPSVASSSPSVFDKPLSSVKAVFSPTPVVDIPISVMPVEQWSQPIMDYFSMPAPILDLPSERDAVCYTSSGVGLVSQNAGAVTALSSPDVSILPHGPGVPLLSPNPGVPITSTMVQCAVLKPSAAPGAVLPNLVAINLSPTPYGPAVSSSAGAAFAWSVPDSAVASSIASESVLSPSPYDMVVLLHGAGAMVSASPGAAVATPGAAIDVVSPSPDVSNIIPSLYGSTMSCNAGGPVVLPSSCRAVVSPLVASAVFPSVEATIVSSSRGISIGV